jgi:hypothetical protein
MSFLYNRRKKYTLPDGTSDKLFQLKKRFPADSNFMGLIFLSKAEHVLSVNIFYKT